MLGSCCCVCVSSGLQTDATTHQQCWKLLRLCWQWCANGCNNNQKCWGVVASVLAVVCKRMQQQPTMLRVVASVLAMVCKRMQQQPTMLGVVASLLASVCKRTQKLPTLSWPAMHREKDTTHMTLETMCNARAWPQQCWKSCANGSTIVALRVGDHGTKEMLGVVGSKVWPVSNFVQQPTTTYKTDVTCNIQQDCELLANNVTSVFTGLKCGTVEPGQPTAR